jgi:hypothetical protein
VPDEATDEAIIGRDVVLAQAKAIALTVAWHRSILAFGAETE